MADLRNARLITKRTSVPGKIPTGTTGDESSFIRAGELASNLADKSLWGYDGISVFEYGSNSFLGLTGGTITGNTNVFGNFSATTLFSGGTNLYNIFSTTDTNDITRVQQGANIITGGTGNFPIVNLVASPSLNGLTLSGTGIFNIFSATTISANTVSVQSSGFIIRNPANTFSNIFASSAIIANRIITIPLLTTNDTLVTAAFTQTLTNKTLTSPVINTQITGSVTNGTINATNCLVGETATQTLTNKTAVTFSGGTLSGGTIFSGSTNLYSIFQKIGDVDGVANVNAGTNITTGGTSTSPIINLVDSPSVNNITFSGSAIGGNVQADAGRFTSLSATTLSGGTILSGGTNLYDIFLTLGDLSGTSVSAGSNISIQQSGNDYIVSVVDSPSLNQLTASGLTTINSNLVVTGDTTLKAISATTYYTEEYIQFNPSYTAGTVSEGRMYWDENNQTVSIGLHNDVSMQLGQETYYLIKNQSGATIQNGRVVRAAGTLGSSGRILGQYMIADGTIPAKYTLGIAIEDIINGDDGYVTEFGLVRGINTTGSLYGETWANGDVLWVSPTVSGGLTNVEPQFPSLKIEMAMVVNAAANGTIFVRPHRYPSTNEIQDIISSGKTNNSILQYSSTLSGYTNTTTPILTSISATTISGGTVYSGSTNLYDIFEPINKSPYNTFILTAGTSYSFTGAVNSLSVNKTIGSSTQVNLPSNPSVNDFYVVKDRKGDSNINPITISGGTKTIDGNISYLIKSNNKPSLTFLFDGSEYIII